MREEKEKGQGMAVIFCRRFEEGKNRERRGVDIGCLVHGMKYARRGPTVAQKACQMVKRSDFIVF